MDTTMVMRTPGTFGSQCWRTRISSRPSIPIAIAVDGEPEQLR